MYANLFISGTTDLTLHNKPLRITQQNNNPWQGDLKFTVTLAAATNFNASSPAQLGP